MRTSSPFRARKIQRFLTQPFYVAEQFTVVPGKSVKLADTARGVEISQTNLNYFLYARFIPD